MVGVKMKTVIRAIAKWILKLVDFDVELDGDNLFISVQIGGVEVWSHTFDFNKDNNVRRVK